MRSKFIILIIILCMVVIIPITAQETTPEPEVTSEAPEIMAQVITIDAEDRLDLIADFYLVDSERPTVILLHEIYTGPYKLG